MFFCGLGHINALRASEAVRATDVMFNSMTSNTKKTALRGGFWVRFFCLMA